MKTVFSNQELFHIYASGAQEYGRSANGNVYFENGILYSYGKHFPIALEYGGKYLFTRDSYSVTTSKHVSQARSALRHRDCIELPALRVIQELLWIKGRAKNSHNPEYYRQDLPKQAAAYCKGMAREIQNAQGKLKRARSDWMKEYWQGEIELHERAARFAWQDIAGRKTDPIKGALQQDKKERKARLIAAIEFDLSQFTRGAKFSKAREYALEIARMRRNLNRDVHGGKDLEYIAIRVRAACESRMADLRRKRVAINAGNREFMTKAMQSKLKAAHNNAQLAIERYIDPIYSVACAEVKRFQDMTRKERESRFHAREIHSISGRDIICRVHNDNVETSGGARVPLKDAMRLFKFAQHCRNDNEGYKGGLKIGHYNLNEIDPSGNVTIGCHYITWDAISDCAARYMPELLQKEFA
jgi:hypothetical protein